MKLCAIFLAAALAGASATHSADQLAPTDGATLGPFGIGSCHTNNRSVQDAARWIQQTEAIGLRSYRAGPTGWSEVEPEQGKWDWKALDEHMSYLAEHGFV